jgi:hypothetical protein
VTIRGDGVAAYCCAYLLSKAGFGVKLEAVDRPRLPVILLSDQALALLRDVFEQPHLFADAPRVWRRVVAWRAHVEPRALDHSASIVSETELLDALRPRLTAWSDRKSQWTIFAARPLPAPASELCFGARMASAMPVKLRHTSAAETCWIEALEDGWLFLVPGWLLAVGAAVETLLGRSRVVAREIAECGPSSGTFPAFPRITSPLAQPGWLACGSAAMAFDPICGDGTAHAVREAILAAAVVRALDARPVDDLLSHYQARLTAGFRRHLMLCRDFYSSGGTGSFWRTELASIDRGIRWCSEELASHREFRFQLRGFELEAVR